MAATRVILLLALAGLGAARAEERGGGIVDQRDYADSRNGCAPASVLNLLVFGPADYRSVYESLVGATDGVKMRFLVDRYFKSRRSTVEPSLERWGVHGIFSADLAAGVNELLADHGIEELAGASLDREDGETAAEHLRRCHERIADSLANGVKPILSLRSYVVRHREEEDFRPAWEAGVHHNVVVTEVIRPPSGLGFEIEALDPWRGRRVALFVHRGGNAHPFRARKGAGPSAKWLEGHPYLQVLAPDVPSLRPRTLEWSERFVVTANFLIGDY